MLQKKEIKIFLNCLNGWFSNFLIEELRTDCLMKSKIQYSFMGTIDDSGRPLPYLFEPKITNIEIGYNYEQEVFENDIIILNLNDSNLEEAEFIIRGLKSIKYNNQKLLIIISNIMTWADTPLKIFTEEEKSKYNLTNEEEIPKNINEKINMNESIENESKTFENFNKENEEKNIDNEIKEVINERKINNNIIGNNKNMNEEIKEIKEENEEEKELNEESNKENDLSQMKSLNGKVNNIEGNKKEIKKIYFYKEEDYPKRIPNSLYYNFKIIETLALQIKNPNLNTYIVCPGFVYGCGEEFFFDYFKKSWLGGVDYFPIRGNGYNYFPTIHILDLVQIIKRIINLKPDIKYIFACDRTKEPLMRNVISSITKKIGGIDVKPIKEYNIDEMEIINYCELKINIPMKTSSFLDDEKRQMGESLSEYNKRLFNWHCEGGIEENINLLINEFKLYRDIKPIRIIINGPPSGGKMTIAKILSEKYKLSIFNIKTICEWAEKLGDSDPLGIEIKQKNEEIEEIIKKAVEEYEHRKNKKKSDPPLDINSLRKYPNEFINKLVKERITRDECLFKGYILVNYPKNYKDCINLFSIELPKEIKNEEENLENKDIKEIKDNKENKEIKEHKDNKHIKDKKEEDKENNEEIEENKEIIKDLLPENAIIINNYTEESLKGKLQKNPEYNEKQQEIDARFNRRLENYKKDNDSQELNQKKSLEDFYKENNINIYYINESNYMENKELCENQLIENLENNGVINNYSKLFDEEDEVIYLKPIINESKELDTNQKMINLEEEENNKNTNINSSEANPPNINESNNKKNIDIIKEDEGEESTVRLHKNSKKKNEHNSNKSKLKLRKEKEKDKSNEKENKQKENKEKSSKESIEKDKNLNINPVPKIFRKRNSAIGKDLFKKAQKIKIEKTIDDELNDLKDLKDREQKLLEKKSEVLRRYLSENIMPLLAKGVLHVCHNLPNDPVEELANYLVENSFDLQKGEDRPIGELEKIMKETEH